MAEREDTLLRLTKVLQCALLLVLYLCRAGRARLMDIASSLRLSLPYLRVIATRLKAGRVIKAIKGPGGGYEINGDPLVRDVFGALNIVMFLTGKEIYVYSKGVPEHRALAHASHAMNLALAPFMRRKVRTLNSDLVEYELATLDKMTNFAQVN